MLSFHPHTDAACGRLRLSFALLALGAVLLALLVGGAPAGAQTSAELDSVRDRQEAVRTELATQNATVNALIGEVSVLREREDAVGIELAARQAELNATQAELGGARTDLAASQEQLAASIEELEGVLVAIYKSDRPDMLGVVLDANSLGDVAAQSTYLERIQDYQDRVIERVRVLRAEADLAVDDLEGKVAQIADARDEIASRQKSLAASRLALEARESALAAARDDRRDQLADLQGDERSLVAALTAPEPEPAPATSGTGESSAPAAPAPTTSGSTATLNSDGTASAPADAPDAVKNAIAAANAISDRPYLWGGGHGSFESPGYDCSGAISYALHGGGMLSTPLDSTGFMTYGESGPGNWITIYANPGHAYVVIAGLRFDTSGGAGPRWQGPRETAGFVATHPPGY